MDKEKIINEIKEIVNNTNDKYNRMIVKEYYIFGIKFITINSFNSIKVKK